MRHPVVFVVPFVPALISTDFPLNVFRVLVLFIGIIYTIEGIYYYREVEMKRISRGHTGQTAHMVTFKGMNILISNFSQFCFNK